MHMLYPSQTQQFFPLVITNWSENAAAQVQSIHYTVCTIPHPQHSNCYRMSKNCPALISWFQGQHEPFQPHVQKTQEPPDSFLINSKISYCLQITKYQSEKSELRFANTQQLHLTSSQKLPVSWRFLVNTCDELIRQENSSGYYRSRL